MQEVTINPGEKLDPPIARNADATTLGAVALFRQPAGTTWRAIVKLSPPDPQYCHRPRRPKTASTPSKNDPKLVDNVTRIFLDENRLELR